MPNLTRGQLQLAAFIFLLLTLAAYGIISFSSLSPHESPASSVSPSDYNIVESPPASIPANPSPELSVESTMPFTTPVPTPTPSPSITIVPLPSFEIDENSAQLYMDFSTHILDGALTLLEEIRVTADATSSQNRQALITSSLKIRAFAKEELTWLAQTETHPCFIDMYDAYHQAMVLFSESMTNTIEGTIEENTDKLEMVEQQIRDAGDILDALYFSGEIEDRIAVCGEPGNN